MKSWTMKSWILAFRPKTLTAALVPIGVGTALSYSLQGTFQPWMGGFALISAVLIQIGTNLINDAVDFKKGADTAERVGPQRVTQSGLLTPQQVMGGGWLCFLLALVFGIPLVLQGGWPIVAIGVLSLLAGYSYTGGPFPLAYLGLGDVFVVVFFGWVAVGGVYYLNSGQMDGPVWVAGTQVGLLAAVLIAINNVRDQGTDRKVSKKTLPVRLGIGFGQLEITLLCLVPFLGSLYWLLHDRKWAALLPWALFPVALSLVKKIYTHPPGAIYNRFLAQGAALHLGFGLLLSLGLCLSGFAG